MTDTTPALPTDSTIRLRDGRTLSYSECGSPDGKLVVVLHGNPGSRLVGPVFHSEALACGVRLVSPDRPGYGNSTFRRQSMLEYVSDVVQLADGLGTDRFAILGVSGGGPFALAAASSIPERLTGVAVVSGIGPMDTDDSLELITGSDRSLIKLARRAPWALAPVTSVGILLAKPFTDRMIASTLKSLPDADRASLDDPHIISAMKASSVEAFRHGTRGFAWDVSLFSRPWGFALEDVKMPILLWQGEEDTTVLPDTGRRLAAAIPNCSATFCAGAGHYLIAAHMVEILSALAAKQ